LDFLTLENVADSVSRNVSDYHCTLRDIQKSEYFSRVTPILHLLQVITLFSCNVYFIYRGPGSLVGIAFDYGVDGPGSNPGRDEIFRPSRPALGLTQPPVKLVPGLFRG
jgi:hypothetical protein